MALEPSKAALQAVGNYDLVEKIFEGGMGEIYRGRHRDTGQVVAIKVMPEETATNPVLLKRFEQEFRAASRLNHPNIVRALDYGDSNGKPYLVMEFVAGESLGRKLEREGRMPEAEAIRIITQVAEGLHQAHKENLIHRDVKPDNILVSPDGIVKLADLGLVKERKGELDLTQAGRGLGTPQFMAPEQFNDAKHADIRCDIYSLGATLYQMVTGELPFRGKNLIDTWMKKAQNELTAPRALVPTLSERVERTIVRAMNTDPESRPKSCREFVEDLTTDPRRGPTTPANAPVADLWYLVYKDDAGTTHLVKDTAATIRASLKDSLLGNAEHIRASRNKAGPFEPLRGLSEFRDLLVTAPQVVPSTSRPNPPALVGPRPSHLVSGAPTKAQSRDANVNPTNGTPAQVNALPIDSQPTGRSLSLKWVLWGFVLVLAAASVGVVHWLISLK